MRAGSQQQAVRGSVSRAAKGADCKSAGSAFEGSSPSRPTLNGSAGIKTVCAPTITLPYGGPMLQSVPQRVITPVVWYEFPDWLTVEQACYLSGHSLDDMLFIIEDGGVDLNLDGLIDKASLYEFQESLALVLHWDN